MERLTKRYIDEIGCNFVKPLSRDGDILHRLADYEDLEEQGLLVRLPCKVGDKVYHISSKKINEKIVTKTNYRIVDDEIDVGSSGIYVNDIYDKQDTYYHYTKLGVSLFTTRAEAEKRLKELKVKK